MHDPDYLAVWLWCLLEACFSEKESILGGKKIMLQPGQFTTGRKQLSEISGVQESKVERVLNFFESDGQIEQQKTNTNRLISIINWNEYQGNEQQMNNKRTTNEQQMNTPKECNNEKNEKKTSILVPEHLLEIWPDFISMRRKIRKPATERAQKNIFFELEKLAPNDKTLQIQIIEQSITNSWQGVFPLKEFEKKKNDDAAEAAEYLNRIRREREEKKAFNGQE